MSTEGRIKTPMWQFFCGLFTLLLVLAGLSVGNVLQAAETNIKIGIFWNTMLNCEM